MNELSYFDNPINFQQELKRIAALRKRGKVKTKRRYRLTKEERKMILAKTGGKCHICGQEVVGGEFEADHVKSHSSGGTSVTDNFLPACKTCNNYRWHYLPEEFKWILKLGVWARTEIEIDSLMGRDMANNFMKREKKREARRKNPRTTPIKKKTEYISKKRYVEIILNIETVKPENESEERLITQLKKIKKDGGVAEIPDE